MLFVTVEMRQKLRTVIYDATNRRAAEAKGSGLVQGDFMPSRPDFMYRPINGILMPTFPWVIA
jgi:hypothetical protein